ncbi:MAG: hypothetical protein KJO98_06470 [Rhodothermia bacterium]|nr:hypothetical protein [Rhodothermia bacterium]
MSRRVVLFLVLLLSCLAPRISSAQAICSLLQEGDATAPNPYPATVTSSPPDISKLVIQVYSTRPLDATTAGGATVKCNIAYDLYEVDRMTMDIGFGGYPTPDTVALFTEARVKYVDTEQDRETIREVVRQILNPGGIAESAIQNLKANTALFNQEILNVYYVDPDQQLVANSFDYVSRLTGMHIRTNDGYSDKMIFIGDSARSDTVAHEFAHALSGGHVNFWDLEGDEWCIKFLPHPGTSMPSVNMECEFDATNYMWAASLADRAQLIDAQKQRMMYNRHSVIFDYSPPDSGDVLECPDFSADPSKSCPRMGL